MYRAVMLVMVLAFFSVSGWGRDGAGGDVPVLYIYSWKNFIAPEVVREFEEEHGCVVEFEYYDSNEVMIEKLRGGGGYDIITPTGLAVEVLEREGVLARLDRSLLPNVRHLHSDTVSSMQDSGMEYSVPYAVSLSGIGYNTKLVPADFPRSWGVFGDARLAGRVTMMNDAREALGAALKYKGYSLNSTDVRELEEAGGVLLGWSHHVDRFSLDDACEGLRDGKYAVIQGFYGDIAQVMAVNEDIRFFIPREGTAVHSDKLAVCVDSENPVLAHAFINHLLEPGVAARNMERVRFFMPNVSAIEMLGARLSRHPALTMSPELRERCEVIRYLGEGDAEVYDGIWARVLIGE